MDAPIHICKATAADAGIISRIVERSIRVGCAPVSYTHLTLPTTPYV